VGIRDNDYKKGIKWRTGMNNINRKHLSVLINTFIENVKKQRKAIRKGIELKDNEIDIYVKRYISSWKEIYNKYGEIGTDRFMLLLNNKDITVRLTAAVLLLKLRPKKALSILKKEAEGDTLSSFEAKQAINNWESGNWHLDINEL
jgi:hypothetical protein